MFINAVILHDYNSLTCTYYCIVFLIERQLFLSCTCSVCNSLLIRAGCYAFYCIDFIHQGLGRISGSASAKLTELTAH